MMNVAAQIPSVNFHLWKPCNMKCNFCFATSMMSDETIPLGGICAVRTASRL